VGKANPGKTAPLEDINGQIYQTAYNEAMNASGFGTGGKYQQAIQAAAVQGLAGSDLSAALAGGAATGELVGMIALEMYDKSADKQDETQKQTVSALATLAAGLSGGLVGDSSASAVAGRRRVKRRWRTISLVLHLQTNLTKPLRKLRTVIRR